MRSSAVLRHPAALFRLLNRPVALPVQSVTQVLAKALVRADGVLEFRALLGKVRVARIFGVKAVARAAMMPELVSRDILLPNGGW